MSYGKSDVTDDQTGIASPRRGRRWLRRGFGCLGIALVLLIIAFFALGGPGIVSSMRGPAVPFDPAHVPPAPDYAKKGAWLALAGRPGQERSTTPGVVPIDEAQAPADVFFIAPTTYKGSPVWNGAYDAPYELTPLNPPVLLEQASVFNGCCRIYAPHYRQATLAGLGKSPPAVELAYADVAAAFRYYIAYLNHGRPFILASHSQGTGHAIKLLQAEILGTPIKDRMIAAYLIGGYIPDSFADLGLPTCDAPLQTGCVLSYNTNQTGRTAARILIDNKTYWWRGRMKSSGQAKAICVNPLNWRREGAAPASANEGAMPFPQPPFRDGPTMLAALVPHLTGAVCHDGLLDVDIPWSAPSGFIDKLSILYGSYHLSDYGVFYGNLRSNARDRVAAWVAAHPRTIAR